MPDKMAAEDLPRHVLHLGIHPLPGVHDEPARKRTGEAGFLLRSVHGCEDLVLLSSGRLGLRCELAFVRLAPQLGLLGPPKIQIRCREERLQRKALRALLGRGARHHREVARGDVHHGFAGVFHADPHLHRTPSHVVDAGAQNDVSCQVGNVPDEDVVDRGGHDPRVGMELANVGEGRLLRDLVEDLEEQPEPEVSPQRLVDDQEPAAQRRVCAEGDDVRPGGLFGMREGGHGLLACRGSRTGASGWLETSSSPHWSCGELSWLAAWAAASSSAESSRRARLSALASCRWVAATPSFSFPSWLLLQ